ncbi:hypothetical protein GCM10027341_09630 [Spirosoma knui]
MGITTLGEAEGFSQQLQEQGQKLARIEKLLAGQKETLTLEEAATYAGLSVSHFYKLTSTGRVPHYKPAGKVIYFDRAELDAYLKRNRVTTTDEIEQQAATYVATKPAGKGGVAK